MHSQTSERVEGETQLAMNVPAALSLIMGLEWGQWPPVWLRGCCLFQPAGILELTLTVGGQGAKVIQQAGASE